MVKKTLIWRADARLQAGREAIGRVKGNSIALRHRSNGEIVNYDQIIRDDST